MHRVLVLHYGNGPAGGVDGRVGGVGGWPCGAGELGLPPCAVQRAASAGARSVISQQPACLYVDYFKRYCFYSYKYPYFDEKTASTKHHTRTIDVSRECDLQE